MPYVTVKGNRFHYQQTGQGPTVILVHAVTSNLAVWLFSDLMGRLARDYQVTAYDLRGHGLSDVTPAGYTSAEMAEDLAALHEALGLGPAYLVGHSFGAVVAAHAAVVHPWRVKGLVLADPYFPGLAAVEPNLPRANVWVEVRQVFAQAGIDLSEDVDLSSLFRTAAELTPGQMKKIRAAMGPASARWLAVLPRLANTTCGADVFAVAGLTADRLLSMHQPVVALYDEHSPFLATCKFLHENLPDCTVDIVPGAGHLAPVQNPGAFVDRVERHLAELRGRASPKLQLS
jgi:3-oxoadipate enol-lactonase